jgi:hypothetical protein
MEALSRIFSIAGSTMAAVSALMVCPAQPFELTHPRDARR